MLRKTIGLLFGLFVLCALAPTGLSQDKDDAARAREERARERMNVFNHLFKQGRYEEAQKLAAELCKEEPDNAAFRGAHEAAAAALKKQRGETSKKETVLQLERLHEELATIEVNRINFSARLAELESEVAAVKDRLRALDAHRQRITATLERLKAGSAKQPPDFVRPVPAGQELGEKLDKILEKLDALEKRVREVEKKVKE
jgi:hypothetical protein